MARQRSGGEDQLVGRGDAQQVFPLGVDDHHHLVAGDGDRIAEIVASRADNAFTSRDFLTFKASADTSFTGGTYSGTVTFVFVGDY